MILHYCGIISLNPNPYMGSPGMSARSGTTTRSAPSMWQEYEKVMVMQAGEIHIGLYTGSVGFI